MKTIHIAGTSLHVSRIALGCMRLNRDRNDGPLTDENRKRAVSTIRAGLDEGINFFDHADIYGRGRCEEVFSAIWSEVPHLRERIVLQSKCGIRLAGDPNPDSPGRYDFSSEYILRAVEGSLARLKTDYLDVLLLHRPDALVEPDEVASAFDQLQASGKVRYFGVSNHTAAQIELLKHSVKQPLVVNQVELSIVHTHLFDEGIAFNQDEPSRPIRGNGTLEYCRQHDILIQAWGPLAAGTIVSETDSSDPRAANASRVIADIARRKNVSREAIAVAWLLRHPAGIQPILGTTNPDRIRASCQADAVELTREEWYRLFIAGRGGPLP